MQSIDRPEPKKVEVKPQAMKRFVIREVEAIQTTRAAAYCMCCCQGC